MKFKNSKNGIALVIVLGLIALLMITSVTFTINMRVERAGAANLRHAAVARQLARGGMAHAIATIDSIISTNAAPGWYDKKNPDSLYWTFNTTPVTTNYDTKAKGSREVKIWKDTLISVNENVVNQTDDSQDGSTQGTDSLATTVALTASAEKYLPPGISYRAIADRFYNGNASTDISHPEWIPIYSSDDSVIGRYAFVAFDTSAMLDASVVGAEERGLGKTPAEIQIANKLFVTNEFTSVQKANAFVKGRHAYETIAEMRADQEKNLGPGFKSFNTFSYEPKTYDFSDLTSDEQNTYLSGDDIDGKVVKIDLSKPVDELRKEKDAIVEAFYRSGLTFSTSEYDGDWSEQAEWAYYGLIDYIDEDGTMEGNEEDRLSRPATEAMPLFDGGIGNISIKAEDKLLREPNDDMSVTNMIPVTEYKISVHGRVHFVYPYRRAIPYQDIEDTEIEGKMIIGFSDFDEIELLDKEQRTSDAFPNKECSGTLSDDDISDECFTITGDRFEKEWTIQVRKSSEKNTLEGTKIHFCFAGKTEVDSDVQRRYPSQRSAYMLSEEDDIEELSEAWMHVAYELTDKDIKAAEESDGFCRTIWAEFVDPRFYSSKAREQEEGTRHAMYLYLSSESEEYSNIVRKFENDKDLIEEIRNYTQEDFDDNFNDETRTFTFKGYFNPIHYTPVIRGIFERPEDIALGILSIHSDGVSVNREVRNSWYENSEPTASYVKNAPLDSPGELGYLPIGPWMTIRLYDYRPEEGDDSEDISADNHFNTQFEPITHIPGLDGEKGEGFHTVLDNFTVGSGIRGKLNINSSSTTPIAAAFAEMPIQSEDNPVEEETLDIDNHLEIIQNLADIIRETSAHGNLKNLSDLGKIYRDGETDKSIWEDVFQELDSNSALCEFDYESIIRNSCGLFTTRGQSFIVIVRAESFSPMFGGRGVKSGTVNATKTAIAQIWRDTVQDENGKYPVFVKYFKIVDD